METKTKKFLAGIGIAWSGAGIGYGIWGILQTVLWGGGPGIDLWVILYFFLTVVLSNLWVFEIKEAFPEWTGIISLTPKHRNLFHFLLWGVWICFLLQLIGTVLWLRRKQDEIGLQVNSSEKAQDLMGILFASFIIVSSVMLLIHCLAGLQQFIPRILKRYARMGL